MAADDDGLLPSRDETRDGGDNNGCAEDGSSSKATLANFGKLVASMCDLQMVSNGAIGRQPHLLELELLYTLLVWGNGCALDANRVLFDSLGGIERDLVVGLITVWQAQVVVLEVNVEIGVNKLQW